MPQPRRKPKLTATTTTAPPAVKITPAGSVPPISNDPVAIRGKWDLKHAAPSWFAGAVRRLREFSGLGSDATYLWPRWLVLRAVGIVYLFIFAGIISEGRALIGPGGVSPAGTFLSAIKQLHPTGLAAFFAAPGLFWVNSSLGSITTLEWLGFAAAVALVLNVWPRMALFVCWGTFLSFVSAWADFSPAQLDRLMLETALLCIPFAPPGVRPGLGAESPPRTIAVFMLRWLLLRVMFESGLVKIVSGDPHWRNLTAMDVMYETSPSPTILGYWAHHLPHPVHLLEIALTFAAELLAPIVAAFGGRRGRWMALAVWTVFQAGIQLTCNFGWLNTGAIGLGLLLLDDQMVSTAAAKLRLAKLSRYLGSRSAIQGLRRPGFWRLQGLRLVLGAHFCVTLFYFATVCGMPLDAAPSAIGLAVKSVAGFCSANGYSLYGNFDSAHYQVDFEGSNDHGKTWRAYEYRYVPQRVDRVSPFLAPWFPRFEATIQIESWSRSTFSVLPIVASRLLARNPDVLKRFVRNPFPDRPPTVVRMRRYRLTFTDLETHRETGAFWRKEFAGDFLPAMYLTDQGAAVQFSLAQADAALNAGNPAAAIAIFEQQYQLGNLDAGLELADVYAQGLGVPAQPEKAFALLSDLANRGEVNALHNLGACYQYGVGVPVNDLKAAELYRRAANLGNLLSVYALGTLAAQDRIVPRDDIEGLSMLLRAAARGDGDPSFVASVGAEEPELAKRLMDRMAPGDITEARRRATSWH